MGQYLSPLVVEGSVRAEGIATVALSATTIFTTPDLVDYASAGGGALYRADAYLHVNTVDGGTTPTVALSILATDNGAAVTYVIPLMTLAGAIDTTVDLATDELSAHGSVVFRADRNTNVQWVRTAGGTPSNNGLFDVYIVITRIG